MHDFDYVGHKLYCEKVSLEALARRFGTPLYVYSRKALTASNYNSRPLAAEVLVSGTAAELVGKRQPVRELWAGEQIPQWRR